MRFVTSSVLFQRAQILSALALCFCGARCSGPARLQKQPLTLPATPPQNRPDAVPLWKDKVDAKDPHLPDVVKARHVCSAVLGVYSVCVETDGRVGSVQPVQSIPEADDAVMATLSTWRFKPQRERSCYRQKLEFRIAGANRCRGEAGLAAGPQPAVDEPLPQRIGPAEEASLSDGSRAANLCATVSAVYRLNIGDTGRVWVEHASGSTAGESEIKRALETWTFRPRATPASFSHTVRLRILCDGTEERLSQTGEVLGRSAPKQRLATADVMLAEKISTDDAPRLPAEAQQRLGAIPTYATYFLCVGRDGVPDSVGAVESLRRGSLSLQELLRASEQAVIATLLRWRFKPREQRTCFAKTFSFAAE